MAAMIKMPHSKGTKVWLEIRKKNDPMIEIGHKGKRYKFKYTMSTVALPAMKYKSSFACLGNDCRYGNKSKKEALNKVYSVSHQGKGANTGITVFSENALTVYNKTKFTQIP